jgi:hypothetical protein
LPLYVVQITEVDPPSGEKAVDWTLLTNEPLRTFEDAWRVASWYERRWIGEEYHKAQKTGCQIEDLQFTASARLEPAIALLSVVAVTLLNLRDASRRPDAKTRRATAILAPDYVNVLIVSDAALDRGHLQPEKEDFRARSASKPSHRCLAYRSGDTHNGGMSSTVLFEVPVLKSMKGTTHAT